MYVTESRTWEHYDAALAERVSSEVEEAAGSLLTAINDLEYARERAQVGSSDYAATLPDRMDDVSRTINRMIDALELAGYNV